MTAGIGKLGLQDLTAIEEPPCLAPHLNACERYAIEQLTLYGLSDREIGRRLGRSHTTIGRERVRNGPQYSHPTAVYVGRSADQFANTNSGRGITERKLHLRKS